METRCICLGCLYSAQPCGYFPIICVHGKRIIEMWHEKYRCKHFEPCQALGTGDASLVEEPEPAQEPWQVILAE